MNSAIDHKCPNCDSVLKFNPHTQSWVCEYCRGEFNLEEIDAYNKKSKKVIDESIDSLNEYVCNNCGALIVASPNVSTTSCIYCKNTAILKNKLQGEFSPKYLIPFKYTKEDAIEAFKKLGKGKILMPKEFNNTKNINEMSGIYIPFWLYDYDSAGTIEADCKKITTWRSGNYSYTKTDTFLATRTGSMSFERIPVDGSKRFENDIMNSIEPFDYKDLKDFNLSYLSGFLSEKYDVNENEAETEAEKRAKNSFIEQLNNDIVGYNTVVPVKNDITLKKTNCNYVLLPVWMLNIKYKDKIYTFAMNGQTGKLLGNIPIDKKKAVLIFVIMFILLTLIITGINLVVMS